MRIAAGAGDADRMLKSLGRLSDAIKKPGGMDVFWQWEADEALRFTREPGEPYDERADAIDRILVEALRTVASWRSVSNLRTLGAVSSARRSEPGGRAISRLDQLGPHAERA